jgi:hypothetical protein
MLRVIGCAVAMLAVRVDVAHASGGSPANYTYIAGGGGAVLAKNGPGTLWGGTLSSPTYCFSCYDGADETAPMVAAFCGSNSNLPSAGVAFQTALSCLAGTSAAVYWS